jgi:hypothetical protein
MLFGKDNSKQMRELEELNTAHQNTIAMLKQENANYKQTISAFVGVKSSHTAEIDAMNKKHALELSSLKQELEQERKSVNRKVNKALADIGVKQFAAEEISGGAAVDNSPESLYSKFTSLTGAEKTQFFKAHEATLSRLAGFKSTMVV